MFQSVNTRRNRPGTNFATASAPSPASTMFSAPSERSERKMILRMVLESSATRIAWVMESFSWFKVS
jgi:hypothetical protein